MSTLIKEIMSKDIEYVTDKNTLQEAAEKMLTLNVGELPIVIGDSAVGIITDRDIVVRGIAQGLDPKSTHVVNSMTEGIEACAENDSIEKAAQIMSEKKIRRLPVMDTDGKMSGMVSLRDLALNMDSEKIGEVLMEISK